jgi:hypothetical protein
MDTTPVQRNQGRVALQDKRSGALEIHGLTEIHQQRPCGLGRPRHQVLQGFDKTRHLPLTRERNSGLRARHRLSKLRERFVEFRY